MLSYLQEFAKTVKRETPGFKSISVISADGGMLSFPKQPSLTSILTS